MPLVSSSWEISGTKISSSVLIKTTLVSIFWARTGLPGSEIGLFCAYMDLLGRGSQIASKLASGILRSFLDAYSRTSNQDVRLAQDTLAHWGVSYVFWAPRDPPGDRGLAQDFVRKGVEFLVHSRDSAFLAKSPVEGLLPK